MSFQHVSRYFDLEEDHVLLHSLVGGRISRQQTSLRSFLEDSSAYGSLLSAVRDESAMRDATPEGRSTPSATQHMEINDQRNNSMSVELQRFLREKLPAYMIPTAFVQLDAVPLTPNGKVDRRELPMPANFESDSHTACVAPQTKVEQMIASLWREVLSVERISIHDNFFDLGGNSLMMVEIYNKLREALNREISLIEMFKNPTISTLAAHLSSNHNAGSSFQRIEESARKEKEAINRQKRLAQERKR